jgi:hypothetical protein
MQINIKQNGRTDHAIYFNQNKRYSIKGKRDTAQGAPWPGHFNHSGKSEIQMTGDGMETISDSEEVVLCVTVV